MPAGAVVGFDPALVSAENAEMRIKFFEEKGLIFKPIKQNLVDAIWHERSPMSAAKAFVHDISYAGASVEEKVNSVIKEMKIKDTNFLFTNVLDEIAWLLNLRGKDIEYNPLFFSYLLLESSQNGNRIKLYVNSHKVDHVLEYLSQNNIEILPYESVGHSLENIEDPIIIDKAEINFSLFLAIKHPVHSQSLIGKLKAIKNPREQQGFRESHIRDAVAMTKYFSWLQHELEHGGDLNEWTAALQLDKYRAAEELNEGLSFENISSAGPNAAIIHYAPSAHEASKVTKDQIYLLDSGGQYLDGTIDTTRTIHFGSPSNREKEFFTRVLLGNLDLERTYWPQVSKLAGNDFDILARRRL